MTATLAITGNISLVLSEQTAPTRDNLFFGIQLVCDRLDIHCGPLLMIIHEMFVKLIPPESSLINHSVLDSVFQ